MKYRLQYRRSPGEMAIIIADFAQLGTLYDCAAAIGLDYLAAHPRDGRVVGLYRDGKTDRMYEAVAVEDDAPWSDAARWRAWEAAMHPPAVVPPATLVC